MRPEGPAINRPGRQASLQDTVDTVGCLVFFGYQEAVMQPSDSSFITEYYAEGVEAQSPGLTALFAVNPG